MDEILLADFPQVVSCHRKALLEADFPFVKQILANVHDVLGSVVNQLNDKMVEWFTGRLIGRLHPSTDVRLIWTAVRDGDTYVRRRRDEAGRWMTEAFDLGVDPTAMRDVFDPHNDLHRELEQALEVYKAHLVQQRELHRPERLLDEEATERLRAMGYIQ